MSESPFKIAPPGWGIQAPRQPGARGRTALILLAALVLGLSAAAWVTALMSVEPLPIAVASGRVALLALTTRWLFSGSALGLWAYTGALAASVGLLLALDSEPGGPPMRWALAAAYTVASVLLLASPSVRAFLRSQRSASAARAR